jgi:hypothetical protein
MSKSSSEYRGPVLDELKGKSHFICEICNMSRSMVSLDIHHIKPQAFFPKGSDEVHRRDNLLVTETGCHSATHRIASSLSGQAKDKKSAYELAYDFASGIVSADQASVVASNLLKYAVIVAQATVLKKDNAIAGNDIDLIVTLPPQFNSLLKMLGRTVKDGRGRIIGKERLVMLGVLQLLGSRFPEKKPEIDAYIFSEILKSETAPKRNMIEMSAQRM